MVVLAFWAALLSVAGVVLAGVFVGRSENPMPKNIPRTGKRDRSKTSVKGKRYLCAKCRKRSPKPVKHSA